MPIGSGVGAQIGLADESSYGVYAAPTIFPEFTGEDLDFDKNAVNGKGVRAGGRTARRARRVVTAVGGGGSITFDAPTKGLGKILRHFLGTASSTLISGTAYQQVHTPGDLLGRSATIQKAIVERGGTARPITFLGCKGEELELSIDAKGILQVKAKYDVREVIDSQGLQAATYSPTTTVFHFAQGAITLGGTVTMPTTTALATGGTAAANVQSFSASIKNSLSTDDYRLGGGGKKAEPIQGDLDVTGKLKVALTDQTLYQAYLNDTGLALVLTFQGATISGAVKETLQIVIPEIRINGEIPKVEGDDVIDFDVDFEALDDGTNPLIYVVLNTSETAIS